MLKGSSSTSTPSVTMRFAALSTPCKRARQPQWRPGQPAPYFASRTIRPRRDSPFQGARRGRELPASLGHPRQLHHRADLAPTRPRAQSLALPDRHDSAHGSQGRLWQRLVCHLRANPLDGIETAVTRLEPNGGTAAPLGTNESISLAEAITNYTLNAAYVNFLDHEVGSIEVGKTGGLDRAGQRSVRHSTGPDQRGQGHPRPCSMASWCLVSSDPAAPADSRRWGPILVATPNIASMRSGEGAKHPN